MKRFSPSSQLVSSSSSSSSSGYFLHKAATARTTSTTDALFLNTTTKIKSSQHLFLLLYKNSTTLTIPNTCSYLTSSFRFCSSSASSNASTEPRTRRRRVVVKAPTQNDNGEQEGQNSIGKQESGLESQQQQEQEEEILLTEEDLLLKLSRLCDRNSSSSNSNNNLLLGGGEKEKQGIENTNKKQEKKRIALRVLAAQLSDAENEHVLVSHSGLLPFLKEHAESAGLLLSQDCAGVWFLATNEGERENQEEEEEKQKEIKAEQEKKEESEQDKDLHRRRRQFFPDDTSTSTTTSADSSVNQQQQQQQQKQETEKRDIFDEIEFEQQKNVQVTPDEAFQLLRPFLPCGFYISLSVLAESLPVRKYFFPFFNSSSSSSTEINNNNNTVAAADSLTTKLFNSLARMKPTQVDVRVFTDDIFVRGICESMPFDEKKFGDGLGDARHIKYDFAIIAAQLYHELQGKGKVPIAELPSLLSPDVLFRMPLRGFHSILIFERMPHLFFTNTQKYIVEARDFSQERDNRVITSMLVKNSPCPNELRFIVDNIFQPTPLQAFERELPKDVRTRIKNLFASLRDFVAAHSAYLFIDNESNPPMIMTHRLQQVSMWNQQALSFIGDKESSENSNKNKNNNELSSSGNNANSLEQQQQQQQNQDQEEIPEADPSPQDDEQQHQQQQQHYYYENENNQGWGSQPHQQEEQQQKKKDPNEEYKKFFANSFIFASKQAAAASSSSSSPSSAFGFGFGASSSSSSSTTNNPTSASSSASASSSSAASSQLDDIEYQREFYTRDKHAQRKAAIEIANYLPRDNGLTIAALRRRLPSELDAFVFKKHPRNFFDMFPDLFFTFSLFACPEAPFVQHASFPRPLNAVPTVRSEADAVRVTAALLITRPCRLDVLNSRIPADCRELIRKITPPPKIVFSKNDYAAQTPISEGAALYEFLRQPKHARFFALFTDKMTGEKCALYVGHLSEEARESTRRQIRETGHRVDEAPAPVESS